MAVASGAAPAAIFAALGDPTRLAILGRLSDGGDHSISALASGGPLTRQAVTKHLKVLEGAGLVQAARAGRESRYRYRPQAVQAARAYLETVSAQWDEALGRLKRMVEE